MTKEFNNRVEMRLDDKGRVALPPKFRNLFEGDVVVWRVGNHLNVYTPDGFQEVVAAYNQDASLKSLGIKRYYSKEAQEDRRRFYGNTIDMQLDGSHRVTVPKALRFELGMEEEVIWIGCGDYLELWASKPYLADCARLGEAGGNNTLFAGSPPHFPSAQESDTPGTEGDGQE